MWRLPKFTIALNLGLPLISNFCCYFVIKWWTRWAKNSRSLSFRFTPFWFVLVTLLLRLFSAAWISLSLYAYEKFKWRFYYYCLITLILFNYLLLLFNYLLKNPKINSFTLLYLNFHYNLKVEWFLFFMAFKNGINFTGKFKN